MTFWLAAAGLTALAVAALVWPLLGGLRETVARRAYDRQVYRDQLDEVDRDLARGVLTPEQAEAARLEIQRRLLASQEEAGEVPGERKAGDSPKSPRDGFSSRVVLASIIAAVVAAGTLGLYLELGSPGMPGQPYAARGTAPENAARNEAALARIADLRETLKQEPENLGAWIQLGDALRSLRRYGEAAEAYRQALARGLASPEVIADYGEMLVASNEGQVVPAAREAFDVVRKVNPRNFRARYYEGVALEQEGRRRAALDLWLEVAADSPADVPWRPVLENQIRRLAEALDVPVETIPAAPPAVSAPSDGPNAADIEAAGEMTPEERQAFVESMVSRLAERLEDNPDDAEGWLRLGRAYRVLNRERDAIEAYENALAASAGRSEDDPVRKRASEALSDLRGEP
jgi:cytochrome c-type biogenesis protein CcmH